MIKFTYKVHDDFIDWGVVWDGRNDNDPLLKDIDLQDGVCHPLCMDMDYVEKRRRFVDKNIPGTSTYNLIHKEPSVKIENTTDKAIFDFGPINPDLFDDPDNMRTTGDVVANNPVTLALCELLADDESLEKHSGHTHPYWYRCSLIGNLSILWD